MSICTTDSLHSVKNVVLVQKEDTRKKMLLKSGTGGLTMAEYIEREALRKVLESWRDAHADVDDEQGCGLLEDVIWEVDAQPAADVAPVVRCKDCKHYDMGVCLKIYSDGNAHTEAWKPRNPEDFCSYGERKDVDNAEG